MAAIDDPTSSSHGRNDSNPPTVATFAPVPSAAAALHKQLHRTVLGRPQSPLLIATPPQITRVLALAHPFILPLGHALATVTWSGSSAWPSALFVAVFWLVMLYGDAVIAWGGPMILLVGLCLGLYARTYSPLSTTKAAKGHTRDASDGGSRSEGGKGAQTTLEDIIDTLDRFTAQSHLLLDPLLRLTDLLSSPRSPTEASTSPALAAIGMRVLLVTPIWMVLAQPAVGIITTRRVILVAGTLGLTWHARPIRALRALLWRSRTIRKFLAALTGLELFDASDRSSPSSQPNGALGATSTSAKPAPSGAPKSRGVRFTFVVYQNQRRWLGLGWTASLFAYERAAWTDERLNPSPPKDEIKLPTAERSGTAWQWVEGSEWQVEPLPSAGAKTKSEGWMFYDNKWNNGSTVDGWGKYARRRKWVRDAELVEVKEEPKELPAETKGSSTSEKASEKGSPKKGDSPSKGHLSMAGNEALKTSTPAKAAEASDAASTTTKRRGFFSRRNSNKTSSSKSNRSVRRDDDEEPQTPSHRSEAEGDLSLGDEMKMGLG